MGSLDTKTSAFSQIDEDMNGHHGWIGGQAAWRQSWNPSSSSLSKSKGTAAWVNSSRKNDK